MEELENFLRVLFGAHMVNCQPSPNTAGLIEKVVVTISYGAGLYMTVLMSIFDDDLQVTFHSTNQDLFVSVLQRMSIVNAVLTTRRKQILERVSVYIGRPYQL